MAHLGIGMAVIAPRRSVTEIRFKPVLDFYAMRDDIAQSLLDEFDLKNWSRNERSLTLFDREKLQAVGLENGRVFSVADSATEPDADITELNSRIMVEALGRLEVNSSRIGIRQWFALRLGQRIESQLVQLLNQTYSRADSLADVLNQSVDDLAYVFEYLDTMDQRKSCRVELGAMNRTQWESRVDMSGDQFTSESRKNFVDALPSDFVYLDVDYRLENSSGAKIIPLDDVTRFLDSTLNAQKKLPGQILKDLEA